MLLTSLLHLREKGVLLLIWKSFARGSSLLLRVRSRTQRFVRWVLLALLHFSEQPLLVDLVEEILVFLLSFVTSFFFLAKFLLLFCVL